MNKIHRYISPHLATFLALMLSATGLMAQQKQLLFGDTFNRPTTNDLNDSIVGQQGTLAPLNYYSTVYTFYDGQTFEGSTVGIVNNSLGIDGVNNGNGGGLVYPEHNFTEAAIVADGGFSVTVDIAQYSTAGSGRRMTVGVGQKESELLGIQSAEISQNPADLAVAYRNTTDSLEIYKGGVAFSNEWITVGLPDAPTTMRIDYALSSFAEDDTVTYEVFFDDAATAFTSGSFTWSGTDENYISLISNLSNPSRFDNLEIRGGPTSDDNTAPTPSPMTWVTLPTAISGTTVSMTATNATDENGVEYNFKNTTVTDGSHDSGWQPGRTYTDTNLTAETTYVYTVTARDQSFNYNETAPSTAEPVTTLVIDDTPPNPDPMTWAAVPTTASHVSISMTATDASDDNGVEYYFTCTAGGGNDSGWRSTPTYIDSGLTPETTYTYTVMARDNSPDGMNETAASSAESATTSAAPTTDPAIIYAEDFEGDGGTGLDLVNPTIGGTNWTSKDQFVKTDGSVDGLAGSALLPFSPKTNEVYSLSMDLNHTSVDLAARKYLAIGFSRDGTFYERFGTGNRFPNIGGIAWFMYGQDGGMQTWGGLNAANEIPNDGTYVGETVVNLTVKIDTTGDGSFFTADFLMDGESITDGPQYVGLPVDDINYCGIGSYGTRSGSSPAGSIIDNFELRDGTFAVAPVVDDLTIELLGSEMGLSWYGYLGTSYNLQISENLVVGGWDTITNVAGANADILVLEDSDKTNAFYQVELVPQPE